LALTLVLAVPFVMSRARADDYPSHPIRLIVPYAPGGGADAVARIVAKRVGETIGQPLVIENRGGAGSIIGTEMVKKAEPDGYTLLLGQSGPISINPAIYRDLSYDPVKDFAPITMTTAYPYILVVNAKLPVKTLQDFVALVKSKPGEFNYGTTGIGAANHLVTELFSSKAGLEMTHVPYRGTALAVADLLAGQVTMVFADPISALSHMQAGTLRALAVTSKERSPVAP
jgi:tripartite-type tricarboxylate transporter receptor subunit TctC